MLEEILKYLSLITVAGAAISFVIGLLKWLDQRKRELEQRNYESFHKMVLISSGANEGGGSVMLAQQAAAIYQLQRYREYKFASVPILKMLRENFQEYPVLVKAIDDTIIALNR